MSSDRETRIEERAYALWEAEGHPDGRDEEHWHRAAREIAEETASNHAQARSRRSPRRAPRKRT